MEEESILRGVIDFLSKLGVYDIVLPFLLIFTIVFAILEKTKVLGTETVENRTLTKKNINAMVAFVIAFLVIASTQLVAVVNQVMAHVVLLLILGVSFLLLVGVFFGSKEFTLEQYPGWIKFFMVLMFIGIVVIFLNALDWMQYVFAPFYYWEAEWGAGVIFLLIIGIFMYYVVREPKSREEKK